MKSNRLTNILLIAALFAVLSGRMPAAFQTAVQPVAAAPAGSGISASMPNAVSGYVSIPAGAFHPMSGWEEYNNYGTDLTPTDIASANFLAEVYLPDGATIDSLSCLMKDRMPASQGQCTLVLQRIAGSNPGVPQIMAEASTDHSTSEWATYNTASIAYAQVDNSTRAYVLILYLPYDDSSHYITFGGARIHYYYNAVYMPNVSK
jgi:hypothetical protein